MSYFYTGRTILITGGTGFLGSLLCAKLLERNVKKVISYSRGWDKAEKLQRRLGDPRLRTINGDVCNEDGLAFTMRGVDYVFHCAAYKSVVSAEYNPFEAVRVNVDGTRNAIKAAIHAGVKKFFFISSDKSASPINLYGRTKALGESMAIDANNLGNTRFSVGRWGNVAHSTGSVIPLWLSLASQGKSLPVTDANMTRFLFGGNDAAEYASKCMERSVGGETFVPKLKSATLSDVIAAIREAFPGTESHHAGDRPGEKKHEEMIMADEADRTVDLGWTYAIKPHQHDWAANWNIGGRPLDIQEYNSYIAPRYTIDELVELISSEQ